MWRQKESSQGSSTSVSATQLLCLESQSFVYIGAGIQQVELAIHRTCYIYSVWPEHRGNKSEWSVAAPVLKITPSSNNLQQLRDSPSCRCPSVMPRASSAVTQPSHLGSSTPPSLGISPLLSDGFQREALVAESFLERGWGFARWLWNFC